MYGECAPCHSPKCDNESDIRPKMFKNSQRSLTRKFEFWQSNRNGLLLWRKDGKIIALKGSQLLPSKPRIYNLTNEYTWWRKYKNGNIILKKTLLAKRRKKIKQVNTKYQTKHAEKNHLKIWLYSCLVTESNKCQFDPKKKNGRPAKLTMQNVVIHTKGIDDCHIMTTSICNLLIKACDIIRW